ncbi:MAG: transporter [Pseudomonadota bacterium]
MIFRIMIPTLCALGLITIFSAQVLADGNHGSMMIPKPAGHAPIGVMGDHMHKQGQWMFSYRYMHMDMEGNRINDDEVSPTTIATTVPNRFFGMPMQPPTLRVVPTKMTMEMHMFGAMYAPTDWLTLMAMLNYTAKEMDHITFAGPAGTAIRGGFTTETEGIGDTKLSSLIRLFDRGNHKAHLNLGFSLPTGSTDESDRILTPTGARPAPRLPYAMQLGSGTVDLLPGITYNGKHGNVGWGAQYMGTIRTGSDNGYSWGDKHEITGWASYTWTNWLSSSARIKYSTMDEIDGMDPAIMAPVQTADPDNYGGDRVDLAFGLNLVGTKDWYKGHRIAIEGAIPIEQDLNGPQMETDFMITVGWQKAF